ncbi:MAG TPA: nitroreductase family protein [Longimicrobiales bacterium]
MTDPRFTRLSTYERLPHDEMLRRAQEFHERMSRRRSVRDFADRPVDREVIEACIRSAGTAPSGAHRQPWHFVAVGREDAELRRKLRQGAEEEERRFYGGRAPQDWLDALAALGTDENKPFLENAPWLIVVFAESYGVGPAGEKRKNYYVAESVGIATGILVAAVHTAGLVCLTHTPSPMGFLGEVLGRPDNERPFLILVVGYPEEDAQVPDLSRKPLEEIATFVP